jgi:hypothetical protein
VRRFNDPDDRNRPPEDLTAWLAAGLRRVDAQAWRRWNFNLDDAKRWRAAGVNEALTAAQWSAAGVNPTTVRGWMDAQIAVADAIRWHEFGFNLEQAREHAKKGHNPEQAYSQRTGTTSTVGPMTAAQVSTSSIGSRIQSFLKAGVPHQVMGSYLQTQWTDDEAIAWSKEGIQAWDAKVWRTLGLTTAEAAELHKADMTPTQVIQEWWRAGIPYDEVADWLGAGLSAAEAVEQRASGVTVEQAAALRALRRGGAL